jgi:MYXO-CTERM domain-containing protein
MMGGFCAPRTDPSMQIFRKLGLVVAVLGALAPGAARATYSIVAADRATRQVGGAVTSCVAPSTVAGVYGSAPGRGAVASQAASNRAGRDRAVQLLLMDATPDQIIETLTSAAFDPGASRRQYGVVDMMGRAAGHSGTGNGVFSNDIQGDFEGFTYAIQGNILTGAAVLDQAQTAFRGEACDLAERLMRALEAGGRNNQGDRRCTVAGAPSDSAFLQVDRPGEPAGSYLRLSVVSPRRTNPLPALRGQFDAWRRTHPCPDGTPDPPPPSPSDAGVAVDARRDATTAPPPPMGGTGGSRPPGGTGGTGGTRPPDGAPAPQPPTGTGTGGATPAGTGGAAGNPGPAPGSPAPTPPGNSNPPGPGGAPAAESPPATPPGCECRTGRTGPLGLPTLLLIAAWIAAHRRRR